MTDRAEPTMGEFLAHLETLVGRIEAVFGYAPCARCGVIEKEHSRLLYDSPDHLARLGKLHQFRVAGSELDRSGQDFGAHSGARNGVPY